MYVLELFSDADQGSRRTMFIPPLLAICPLSRCCLSRIANLGFGLHGNLHIWGRNCDRSIQRSPALEAFDELMALLLEETRGHGAIDPARHRQDDARHDSPFPPDEYSSLV